MLNIEGSIIAKAGEEKDVHSKSAVLANICNEYMDFGNEAFEESNFEAIIISTESGHLLAKPIYSLILCINATKDANLGLIKNKLDVLAEGLEEGLKNLKDHLVNY